MSRMETSTRTRGRQTCRINIRGRSGTRARGWPSIRRGIMICRWGGLCPRIRWCRISWIRKRSTGMRMHAIIRCGIPIPRGIGGTTGPGTTGPGTTGPGTTGPGTTGGAGPGAGYIDPSTGVYTIPYHVRSTRLPPESLFSTPFPDPWAGDRFFGSDPFVTLVGSGGGVSLTDDYVDKTSIAISNKKQLYFDVVVQNHQSRIGQQLIVNLYSGSALDGPGGIITNPKLGRRTPFDVLRQRIGGFLVRFETSLLNLQDTYLQISIYGSRADPPILTFPSMGGFTPCGIPGTGSCLILEGY